MDLNVRQMNTNTTPCFRWPKLLVFQGRAGDLEELVTAEFFRLREFLIEEEERIKEKLQKEKEEKLNQLEEGLTQATEQISQLESTAEKLRLKLREDENPEQLKVRISTVWHLFFSFQKTSISCLSKISQADTWEYWKNVI